jgi:hypothetical protein
MTTTASSQITRQAFLSRIRRKLAHEGQKLHISRSPLDQMGPLYTSSDNIVVAWNCDYESLERDCQVLKPGESLPIDY